MLDNLLKDKNVFIFDLDGTLIDSVGIWNTVDQRLLSDLGQIMVPKSVINLNRDRIIGSSQSENPYIDYAQYLKEEYHLNCSVEQLHRYRSIIMIELLEKEVKRKPYASELISLLKERGMSLVLATTTTRANICTYSHTNEDTKILDIPNNFDLILTMEDVKSFKPNPEIFTKVLNTLEVEPKNVIVIEDSIVGIKGAINAGLDTIAVREEHSNESTDEIKKCANVYIDSLQVLYNFYLKNTVKLAKKAEN